jgi:hypothetical protein
MGPRTHHTRREGDRRLPRCRDCRTHLWTLNGLPRSSGYVSIRKASGGLLRSVKSTGCGDKLPRSHHGVITIPAWCCPQSGRSRPIRQNH